MERAIYTILIAIAAIYLFASLFDSLRITPSTAAAAPSPPSANFVATGTLIFYPSNMATVPYLMYQAADGHTASKSLNVLDESNYYGWVGAHVAVTGTVDAEHVDVTSISYLAPP